MSSNDLRPLLPSIEELRQDIESATLGDVPWSAIHPVHREDARNLARYVELRRHDIRGLQGRLAGLGLSSLGRAEPDVLGTVRAVEAALRAMSSTTSVEPVPLHTVPYAAELAPSPAPVPVGAEPIAVDRVSLDRRSEALLGPAAAGHSTRIMVTLPSEAAESAELVDAIIDSGADLVRINCAHD